MRLVGGLAIVLGVFMGGPAVAAQPVQFATLVNSFDQMALHDNGFVTKWTRSPTFRSAETLKPNEEQAFAYALDVIRRNTKLAIERHDDRPVADISFAFDALNDKLTVFGRPAGGITRPAYGLYGGDLRSAAIAVKPDYYHGDIYSFNNLSAHELMHAIGFPGHAQGFDSISSYFRPVLSYTAWDELFMRVLYDKRVTPGMPRVFALPIVCRVMREMLLADGNQLVSDLGTGTDHPYCQQLFGMAVEAKAANDQYRLALAYTNGTGTQRDPEQAKLWAKRAAAQGHAEAKKLADHLADLVSPGQQVALKTPAVGTVFCTGGGGFTVSRVDGGTVDTLNAVNRPFSWRNLFYGRDDVGARPDPVEESMAGLWPLEIGKTMTIVQRARSAPDSPVTARTEIKVLRAEFVTVGKRAVPTVVVERRLHLPPKSPGAAPYDGTWTYWYAPEYGFHVKYTYVFTGPSSGKPQDWTVQEVRLPSR